MQIDKRNADYQVSASNRLVCVCVWPKWPLNLEKRASGSIELALFRGSVQISSGAIVLRCNASLYFGPHFFCYHK